MLLVRMEGTEASWRNGGNNFYFYVVGCTISRLWELLAEGPLPEGVPTPLPQTLKRAVWRQLLLRRGDVLAYVLQAPTAPKMCASLS